ncbi:MAG: hypothetical protein C0600_06450 [Ignavibacteria bacterium]|nr:MAG: hypothetical protein C0600_06450 [Ignavibacteria bacterium]
MCSIRSCRRFSVLLLVIVLVASCTPSPEANDIPITTASDNAKALFMQGREAMEFGRDDEARTLLDEAIAEDGTFALAYFYRALVATSASEWKANTDLATQNRDQVSPGEQYMIDMIPAFVAGDMEKRLSLAKALAEAYPKSPRAQLELARAQQELDDVESARATLEAALSLDASFSPSYRALAVNYLFNEPKDFAQAENYANTYVEQQPNLADAHIVLGDVYRAQLKLTNAREEYTRAAKDNPKSNIAFSKLGHSNTFLGNFAEARDDFAIASRNSEGPFKITSMNFAVYTWLYAGYPERALEENTRVINSIANHLDDPQEQKQAALICYEERCRIAMEADNLEAARVALDMHAELRREQSAVIGSPEFSNGIEASLAVLEGELALRSGDVSAAEEFADKAADFLKDNKGPRKMDEIQYLRGLIAHARGDHQAALDAFSLGNIDWVQVKFYMAQCEDALGNTEAAMALYKDVAEWNFNGLAYALVRGKALTRYTPSF